MSNAKRSAALQGIEVRTDTKGQKRYRGTARDKIVGKKFQVLADPEHFLDNPATPSFFGQ